MRNDPYYTLVMTSPIPVRLLLDLQRISLEHNGHLPYSLRTHQDRPAPLQCAYQRHVVQLVRGTPFGVPSPNRAARSSDGRPIHPPPGFASEPRGGEASPAEPSGPVPNP